MIGEHTNPAPLSQDLVTKLRAMAISDVMPLSEEFDPLLMAAAAWIEQMRAALVAIQEGRGAFSLDHHEFACNVIERSKIIATEALAGTFKYED